MAAVTDVADGEWFDVGFLRQLAAASPVRITLARGERKTQDLRIAGK